MRTSSSAGLFFAPTSWRTDTWKACIFDQPFQIFSVGRHSINGVVLFAGRATEKKNVVVIDPTTIPAEQLFRSNSDRLLRIEIEGPQRRHRSVPIFAVGFLAHIDAEKQTFPFGETSIRPSPLMSPFGLILP